MCVYFSLEINRTSLPSRVEVDAYESSGTLEQGMTSNSRLTKHQERRSSTTWDDATDPLACEGQWGNLEYRVHGNNSFRKAISPTPFHSLHDMERKLTTYVDDIEKSIVLPGYTQGSISVYLPNKLDRFLVAAENLTRILRHPLLAEREDLHDRVRCLHSTTMSALATEFCHLGSGDLPPVQSPMSPSDAATTTVRSRQWCRGAHLVHSPAVALTVLAMMANLRKYW